MMPESNTIFVPGAQNTANSTSSPSAPSPGNSANEGSGVGLGVGSTVRNAANIVNSLSNNVELANVANKLGTLKRSIVASYKQTKHSVYEHLGKVERTVDTELDGRIESLRELHRRYQEVLASAQAYTNFYAQSVNMQRNMSEALGQLASREDSLNKELITNGELMLSLHKNGEQMLKALNYFVSSLDCLTTKTIEDTLATVDRHDQARLEYDIARYEWDTHRKNPNALPQTIDEAEKVCNAHLDKYNHLKEDVRAKYLKVKLTLLEENRCKVVRKQLRQIQSSLHDHFSNSLKSLDECGLERGRDNDDPMESPVMVSVRENSTRQPSFLEK